MSACVHLGGHLGRSFRCHLGVHFRRHFNGHVGDHFVTRIGIIMGIILVCISVSFWNNFGGHFGNNFGGHFGCNVPGSFWDYFWCRIVDLFPFAFGGQGPVHRAAQTRVAASSLRLTRGH